MGLLCVPDSPDARSYSPQKVHRSEIRPHRLHCTATRGACGFLWASHRDPSSNFQQHTVQVARPAAAPTPSLLHFRYATADPADRADRLVSSFAIGSGPVWLTVLMLCTRCAPQGGRTCVKVQNREYSLSYIHSALPPEHSSHIRSLWWRWTDNIWASHPAFCARTDSAHGPAGPRSAAVSHLHSDRSRVVYRSRRACDLSPESYLSMYLGCCA